MSHPTYDRFQFQRECVEKTTGKILNVGCHIDPALLKETFGKRVTNLDDDLEDPISKLTIPADIIHNIEVFPWPFKDNSFEMVVLGDILEDLHDNGIQPNVLKEAHRLAKYLCITTPQDTVERDPHHFTTITENRLKSWLNDTGWDIIEFRIINYLFVPEGYLVYAKRR